MYSRKKWKCRLCPNRIKKKIINVGQAKLKSSRFSGCIGQKNQKIISCSMGQRLEHRGFKTKSKKEKGTYLKTVTAIIISFQPQRRRLLRAWLFSIAALKNFLRRAFPSCYFQLSLIFSHVFAVSSRQSPLLSTN